MKTLIIQIGNSDNKLTQKQWSDYTHEIGYLMKAFIDNHYFSGYSQPNSEFQNAAWITEYPEKRMHELSKALHIVRKEFNQDSIAITTGCTSFI